MSINTLINPISMAAIDITSTEINAVVEVLHSGNLIQGEKVAEFEKLFAKSVGSQYAVAVSSGTAALHLAYLALLRPGSEVLVPTFSHISTASMVHFAGCKPIFCDLDPNNFLISLESANQRLTKQTQAIAPVHLFGNVCDIDAISTFAKNHQLFVIWDAAQAHGTEYRGKPIGQFGDVVTYSFYPTKNMTTGEGGMVTTNDAEVAEKIRLLRSHGQEKKYFHSTLGLHYRMTEINAAIGIEQLKKLEDYNHKRRMHAAYFNQRFSSLKGIKPQTCASYVKHVYHQYTVSLDFNYLQCTRDAFVQQLHTAGVPTAIHYPRPLHQQPAIINQYGTTHLPVSESLSQSVFSLPIHPQLDQEALDYIAGIVIETYDTYKIN